AFLDMKRRGAAYLRPERYEDIYMPKNSGIGPVLGVFAFVLGFAMVWHIWWLVAVCAVAMWIAIIVRSSNDDTEFCLSAAEVKRIEDARFADLAQATRTEAPDAAGLSAPPLRESPT
ncbi:MAG: cytochrome o ubiquinol oxidase subunit I, partial [Alphaproteobacteria bacterium]|nr:cytochrome o ubiquinol oxidase subunit I [Alphaproteobacteria bacterium]